MKLKVGDFVVNHYDTNIYKITNIVEDSKGDTYLYLSYFNGSDIVFSGIASSYFKSLNELEIFILTYDT